MKLAKIKKSPITWLTFLNKVKLATEEYDENNRWFRFMPWKVVNNIANCVELHLKIAHVMIVSILIKINDLKPCLKQCPIKNAMPNN